MKAIGLPPKNSLDVAIVIPSYNEGQDVVETLASIATQRNIDDLKVGIFVVVNNARDAVDEVLASNQATMELLLHLQSDLIPAGLSKRNRALRLVNSWNDIGLLPSKHFGAEEVIISNHQITLIDLSSEGHAPEICNVGLARDTGMRQAIPCTKENGILVSTDADTILGGEYIRNAYDLLSKGEYSAVTGPVMLYAYLDQPLRQIRTQAVVEAENIIGIIMHIWIEKNVMHTMKRKWVPGLAGSNTAIKRSEYIASGGIPHINGAEDTSLGLSLVRQGKKIGSDKGLSIFTDARESDRAEAGCSMGQYMIKRAEQCGDNQKSFTVKHPAACVMGYMLARTVDAANLRNLPENQWKEMVSNYASEGNMGYVPLADEELQDLWELKAKEPLLASVDKNHFLQKYISRLSEKKWELIPILQCSSMLTDMLLGGEDEDVIEYYNKMMIFVGDEMRFCRLVREADMRYAKGKDEWKDVTKDEMQSIYKIPGTAEEESDMREVLLLTAQFNVAHELHCRQVDQKSEGKIEKAIEEGILTGEEGEMLAQFRRKVQKHRMDANIMSLQTYITGQHAAIFKEHVPHMSPEVKRAASQLQIGLIESANLFKEGWDLSEVEALEKRILGMNDVENDLIKDLKGIAKGILDSYEEIGTALSWVRDMKFVYYTKIAKVGLTIKDWRRKFFENRG
ncbi:MAG: glycosyltransferase family 2 protein [Candidatus Peregrinibacteria bacterium]|nr:glycosyltransferase family 2 protein [Candidatus Peregrinibacteria bacterium]